MVNESSLDVQDDALHHEITLMIEGLLTNHDADVFLQKITALFQANAETDVQFNHLHRILYRQLEVKFRPEQHIVAFLIHGAG